MQTLMNAVLLFRFVTSMPTVRILTDLMFVPVNLDLLEMAKLATVSISLNFSVVSLQAFDGIKIRFQFCSLYLLHSDGY